MMERIKFLQTSVQLAAGLFLTPLSEHLGETSLNNKDATLIRELQLLTSVDINVLQDFYQSVLGLPIIENDDANFKVVVGASVISFAKVSMERRPFYHFAFNIPENKIEKAFNWQKQKTAIVHPNPNGPHGQIVTFNHWNAHSVFFLDPAGNLLEYIARHDLGNARPGNFSANDILNVSEIGLIVDDVYETGRSVQESLGLASYRDAQAGFWPIGDENGLLLMIKKDRVWSGHNGQENKVDIFKTKVHLHSEVRQPWKSSAYPYEVS
jgi:catechol-2,3-dioxygenase